MKATLEAEVEIWDIAVFAELAVWERRPDLQLICALARDRGGLDEAAVETVLPGLSARARANLLRHLGYIQLMDRSGALTALGHYCATSGEAPAWEQGVYNLLVARHPLFDSYVLDFKRTSGDAFDRKYDLDTLPQWLAPDRNKILTSATDGARRFSIAGFPAGKGQDPVSRGWELDAGKLSWEIDLLEGTNHWAISGSVGAKENATSFQSPQESVDPSELAGLYGSWDPRWDARQGRVLMSYDGKVGPGGREPFLRTWRYKSVKVGRFGSFDDVVVRDIPVGPATPSHARTWATAITVARTEGHGAYVAPSRWNSEWDDAIAGTPLAGRAGQPPTPTEITEIDGKPISTRTRWLLTAGADLGMEA